MRQAKSKHLMIQNPLHFAYLLNWFTGDVISTIFTWPFNFSNYVSDLSWYQFGIQHNLTKMSFWVESAGPQTSPCVFGAWTFWMGVLSQSTSHAASWHWTLVFLMAVCSVHCSSCCWLINVLKSTVQVTSNLLTMLQFWTTSETMRSQHAEKRWSRLQADVWKKRTTTPNKKKKLGSYGKCKLKKVIF